MRNTGSQVRRFRFNSH